VARRIKGPPAQAARRGPKKTALPTDTVSYQDWLARHTPDEAALTRQLADAEALAYKPLISFITPVYNPAPEVLRAVVESVLAQTYSHWELCLTHGGPANADVAAVLDEYALRDRRINVKYLLENRGISGNSNAAVAMSTGAFVAILDHDDVLAPDMLFEVAAQLNRTPEIDLLYFDEDKLTEDGKTRHSPFFKPDWAPEMLISANYLTHCVIRRTAFDEAGGFDPATDGAQDWDLAFRVTARTARIVHIPKVLYHWRQAAGSTAAQLDAKSWAFETQLDSVERHLRRLGLEGARALYPRLGYLRVVWPTRGDKVSVIIPTKDNLNVLKTCLHSVFRKTTYPNFEIILVDSGSTGPDTRAFYDVLAKDPRVKIVPYETGGQFVYSKANNLGAAQADGAFLLFLNNDTEVIEPDWMEEMVRWAERPEIGVVGAKLLYPDNTVQHAGVVLGMRGHGGHVFKETPERFNGPFGSVEWYRNYMAVTAACMMMRREVFEQVGGFDEAYILAFNDIDLCVQATKLGYRNLYTPHARLYHHEGKSRGGSVPAADILHACDKLEGVIAKGDRYFNPNLSPNHRVPTLSQPDDISPAERMVRMRKNAAALGEGGVFNMNPRL